MVCDKALQRSVKHTSAGKIREWLKGSLVTTEMTEPEPHLKTFISVQRHFAKVSSSQSQASDISEGNGERRASRRRVLYPPPNRFMMAPLSSLEGLVDGRWGAGEENISPMKARVNMTF